MTLRVVHVASGREWRGGQNQVWLLARELRRSGLVEQSAVTLAGSELERRLRAAGVRVAGVPWRHGLDPRALWAVRREARRGGILHAHDAHALTLAGLAATGTPARLVATRRVVFPLRRRGYWVRAERVIAISEAVRERLLRDRVPPDRVVVIRSGISLDEVQQAPPLGVRPRLGLAPDRLLAVNVAALTPEKDHLTLLAAAARLGGRIPTLHWAIAGEGPLRPELERRILELGLTGRVHLLGHLSEPTRLIADASLFVLPSRAEGLGTTVLEAMALGVPVVAARVGGIPEMLARDAGLLVPPGDPDGLAAAVQRVLADGTLRARLVERAGIEVLRFSDRRMAEEVVSVYRSVVTAQ